MLIYAHRTSISLVLTFSACVRNQQLSERHFHRVCSTLRHFVELTYMKCQTTLLLFSNIKFWSEHVCWIAKLLTLCLAIWKYSFCVYELVIKFLAEKCKTFSLRSKNCSESTSAKNLALFTRWIYSSAHSIGKTCLDDFTFNGQLIPWTSEVGRPLHCGIATRFMSHLCATLTASFNCSLLVRRLILICGLF